MSIFSRLGSRRMTDADCTQGICSSCFLRSSRRNKEDVAIDVAGHHVSEPASGSRCSFPEIAMLSLESRRKRHDSCPVSLQREPDTRDYDPDAREQEDDLDAARGLARQRSTTHGNAFLTAQKGRLGFIVEVEHARIERRFVGSRARGRLAEFLRARLPTLS